MSSVPITIHGNVYPKDHSVKPYPATIVGFVNITGLEVGGGPICPPDEVPPVDPPLVIWGGPFDPPHVDNTLPVPPLPPLNPPNPPVKPHEGWNWSEAKAGWYFLYIPGEGEAQPKKR